jgi:hypothetical protein
MCATVQVEIIRCPALEPLAGTRVEAWFLAGVSSGLKEMINFLAQRHSPAAHLICGTQHRSLAPRVSSATSDRLAIACRALLLLDRHGDLLRPAPA